LDVISYTNQFVDGRADTFTVLSDRIWNEPELRWNEYGSMRAQVEIAEAEGFRVTRDVGGIATAFYAEAGTGGPVIAVLGEYDALAGLSQESGAAERRPDPDNSSGHGQGCGHHLLGTGSLLAAITVKNYLESAGLPGRVRYYGCPAEEAAAGKTFMVKAGAFDDVDAAVSWHPSSITGVMSTLSLAYCQAYFRFKGVAAHAGVSPDLGRSALDAAELMNIGVNFLREHMPLDARVHYAFLDAGGVSPNVVQPTAELYYVVRSPTVAGVRTLYDRVRRIAEGAALMTDTALAVEFDGACSELLPNGALEAAMQANLERLGPVPFDDGDRDRARPFVATISDGEIAQAHRSVGLDPAKPRPIHDDVAGFDPTAPRPTMGGSTDVGDVSWVVPTVQCSTACAALGTPMHSWQMVAQGKLPAAHKGMLHAAKVMASTAIDMIRDSDLLARAIQEFTEDTTRRPYDQPIPDGIIPPPLRVS
jgi:aminobenzoyl-glutamate utilization protein B